MRRILGCWSAVIILGLLKVATPVDAAGQYVHIKVAVAAIEHVDDPLLRNVLRTSPGNPVLPGTDGDTYRFAALFPDNVHWLNKVLPDCEDNQYEAFYGDSYPYLPPNTSTEEGCESGNASHGPRLLTRYANYVETECGDNLLGSGKCKRLVAHFMGTIAHVVTDSNWDTFFMRSINENCAWSGTQPNDPSVWADQDLDVILARRFGWDDAYPLSKGDPDISALDEILVSVYKEDHLESTYAAALQEQFVAAQAKISFVHARRAISPYKCSWALQNGDQPDLEDQWYAGPGGYVDTSHEVANMINQVWELMKSKGHVTFRTNGIVRWPDKTTCVDSDSKGRCDRVPAVWPIIMRQ